MSTPAWVQPVVWAPRGPLLAAGGDGVHRVVALAFDPGASALPQSEAFPILAQNIVSWALDWIPAAARPGDDVLAQVPPGTSATSVGTTNSRAAPATFAATETGVVEARQRGTWGVRTRDVATAVTAAPGAAGAVDLAVDPAPALSGRHAYAPWLLLAALIVLLAEWLVTLRPRRLAR
jgi:hypothetical protein